MSYQNRSALGFRSFTFKGIDTSMWLLAGFGWNGLCHGAVGKAFPRIKGVFLAYGNWV